MGNPGNVASDMPALSSFFLPGEEALRIIRNRKPFASHFDITSARRTGRRGGGWPTDGRVLCPRAIEFHLVASEKLTTRGSAWRGQPSIMRAQSVQRRSVFLKTIRLARCRLVHGATEITTMVDLSNSRNFF